MVLPVVMYGCESWTTKKAEHWRIDAFELWCWRRLLRVPWITRRSNQPILKEISPGCSSEGQMLKLKLQYFGHLIWKADSFEKTLMLGKIEGRRRRRRQKMRWLDGITDSMDMGLGRLWELVMDRDAFMGSQSQTQLSNWTELSYMAFIMLRNVASIPLFWEFLSYVDVEICQKLFLHLLMIIWFLFFSLLIKYILLIVSYILNHPCIPGINLMIFLVLWILILSSIKYYIIKWHMHYQQFLNMIFIHHSANLHTLKVLLTVTKIADDLTIQQYEVHSH